MADQRIAVVTGAAQGIGLQVSKDLVRQGDYVVLTGRDSTKLEAAVAEIDAPLSTGVQILDVADQSSVDAFFDWLASTHGRIDVLVNNAGRAYGGVDHSISTTDADLIAEAVDNNALSAWRMMQEALPIMNAAGYGRIVNVSSGMGGLTEMGGGAVPYRVSKTTLNALSRVAAHDAGPDVKVNAVCPGWVRTEMGGPNATRDLSEGAASVLWAANLDTSGPNGGFFRDGQPLNW
ncbi:MAG: SDR family NAD(P)-dependent oxidoreductase [Woeseiaceae bacterium]|nr:SDR family NAD(P)-dependent oxidoreductase [Woeseiaceae bacterium]